MPTTNNNRKILDLKRWESVTNAPGAPVAGAFFIPSRHVKQNALYVNANTTAWLYNVAEDGFVQLPSPALAGTFGVGAAGAASSFGSGTATAASLTATGGTTSTINTNQTLARDLRGFSVHIISGPNAGATLTIVSNTIGANATITVATQASAFTASTVYRLVTPTYYVVGAGTLAAGSFRKYDYATNTWTSLTTTGLPATIGTDGEMVSTPSWIDSSYTPLATGTATSGTGTTLVNTGKNWTVNQWTNFQVRIVSGTGAGQIRTITSNTATALTVPTWTVNPDATSVYNIEGNDDFIYYLGNNAVTLFRYSISGNSWSTLTPTAARTGAPGAGMSADWVYAVSESDWTNENSIINGRRIYSFRGAAGAVLDYYDIAANTWVSAVTYSPAVETFATGSKWIYNGNFIYGQKDATGRWFRYNVALNEMDGWNTMLQPQGAALVGNTAFDGVYVDGVTVITYIYMLHNTNIFLQRQMVI
jgi:hypothetical protein